MKPTLYFLVLLCLPVLATAQTIRYVKQTPSGNGSGSSWANASSDLQGMINASGVQQVWVAAGTYKPGTARTSSFSMKNGVAIYGGFVGTETSLSQRPAINPVTGSPSSSTLSGDIGTVGNTADNCYHVISNPAILNLTNTAVLDGFVITGGNGNGGGGNSLGGGVYNNGSGAGYSCSPSFRNCLLTANSASQGGAMYNDGQFGQASPVLTNCALQGNSASFYGGAMGNQGSGGQSNPVLTNCTFQRNSAIYNGGAMFNNGVNNGVSSPVLTNCVLQSNSAANGGAVYNDGEGSLGSSGVSSPVLTNCTLQTNSASAYGGAMYNLGSNNGVSSPVLTNCALQGNTASQRGGAIYGEGGDLDGSGIGESNPVLTNCSLTGNSSGRGGAMYNANNYPSLGNCVLWNNGGSNSLYSIGGGLSASYCLFEPSVTGYGGANNLTTTTTPFASGTSVALATNSPAINTGNPASVTVANPPYSATNLPATDLAGNARIVGGRVDMGAVESSTLPDIATVSNGLWSSPAVWNVSRSPALGERVRILHVVEVDGSRVSGQVRIEAGGRLLYRAGGQLRQ